MSEGLIIMQYCTDPVGLTMGSDSAEVFGQVSEGLIIMQYCTDLVALTMSSDSARCLAGCLKVS